MQPDEAMQAVASSAPAEVMAAAMALTGRTAEEITDKALLVVLEARAVEASRPRTPREVLAKHTGRLVPQPSVSQGSVSSGARGAAKTGPYAVLARYRAGEGMR